jgi:hypothetical protein
LQTNKGFPLIKHFRPTMFQSVKKSFLVSALQFYHISNVWTSFLVFQQ